MFRLSTGPNVSWFAARAVLASVAMGVLTALCYTCQLNLATTSLLLLLVLVIQAMGGSFRPGCSDDVGNGCAYNYPPGIRSTRGGLRGGNHGAGSWSGYLKVALRGSSFCRFFASQNTV